MLKNQGDSQKDFTFEQRNADENLFFSKGRYADLPQEYISINTLRERLSKVLLNHLIKELPSLKEEMVSKLEGTLAEIQKLGDRRNTTNKQRMVLIFSSLRSWAITKRRSSDQSVWMLLSIHLRTSVDFEQ
jgi:hypothetical protein